MSSHLMILGILLHSLMNIWDVLGFILWKTILNCYPSSYLHIFSECDQESIRSSNQNLKKWQCQSNQSTCLYTPQQNGIIERRNRHFVETARTLVLGAYIPIHHWGNVILTAWFLIDKMSSSSFNHKVLSSILFPNNPLFHISPQVSDCVCFVCDMSPRLDKLSAYLLNVPSWIIHNLKKGTSVTFLKPRNTTCLSMLHSLNKLLTFLYLFNMFMLCGRPFLFNGWIQISNIYVNPSFDQSPLKPSSPHIDIHIGPWWIV